MRISKEDIESFLETGRFGRGLEVHQWLPSTNDRLLSLIREGEYIGEGYVVIALEQKSGRGRQGRVWHSPEGGLYLSILLQPEIPQNQWNNILLLGAIAVYDAIYGLYNLKTTIKWPNDILYADKKLSGILIETKRGAGGVVSGVLGIGINANLSSEEFPREIREFVTSLLMEVGEMVDLNELTAGVLNAFEQLYFHLVEGEIDVRGELENRRTIIGRRVEVMSGGEVVVGRVLGYGENGSVILEVEGGGRREFHEGNLSLID